MLVAANILMHVVTSKDVKLQFGRLKRQEIKERLKKGEKFTNHRVKWLRDTSARLLDTLKESAIEFNTLYRHDCVSVLDMTDALATCTHQIEAAISRQLKEDEAIDNNV